MDLWERVERESGVFVCFVVFLWFVCLVFFLARYIFLSTESHKTQLSVKMFANFHPSHVLYYYMSLSH